MKKLYYLYRKLLEWQLAIKQKKNDEELALNSSILESLYYACKHHCNTPNDFVMISPMMLSRDHNISPRLYQKVTLQVKAACGGWDDIDRLLLTKVACFIYVSQFSFIPSELYQLCLGNTW